jgi:hypothetical protein
MVLAPGEDVDRLAVGDAVFGFALTVVAPTPRRRCCPHRTPQQHRRHRRGKRRPQRGTGRRRPDDPGDVPSRPERCGTARGLPQRGRLPSRQRHDYHRTTGSRLLRPGGCPRSSDCVHTGWWTLHPRRRTCSGRHWTTTSRWRRSARSSWPRTPCGDAIRVIGRHRDPITGIAVVNSIGNFSGFISPDFVGWTSTATGRPVVGLIGIASTLLAGRSSHAAATSRPRQSLNVVLDFHALGKVSWHGGGTPDFVSADRRTGEGEYAISSDIEEHTDEARNQR